MIDHDALARRIADSLALNSVRPHARLLTWECIARELREALPTSEEACEWTGSEWEMIGKWDTSCGKSYYVVDDEPGENGFRFCCYCGKKLIEVPFEDDEDFES